MPRRTSTRAIPETQLVLNFGDFSGLGPRSLENFPEKITSGLFPTKPQRGIQLDLSLASQSLAANDRLWVTPMTPAITGLANAKPATKYTDPLLHAFLSGNSETFWKACNAAGFVPREDTPEGELYGQAIAAHEADDFVQNIFYREPLPRVAASNAKPRKDVLRGPRFLTPRQLERRNAARNYLMRVNLPASVYSREMIIEFLTQKMRYKKLRGGSRVEEASDAQLRATFHHVYDGLMGSDTN